MKTKINGIEKIVDFRTSNIIDLLERFGYDINILNFKDINTKINGEYITLTTIEEDYEKYNYLKNRYGVPEFWKYSNNGDIMKTSDWLLYRKDKEVKNIFKKYDKIHKLIDKLIKKEYKEMIKD